MIKVIISIYMLFFYRWTELFYGDMQAKHQRDRAGSIISLESVEHNAAAAASGMEPVDKVCNVCVIVFMTD